MSLSALPESEILAGIRPHLQVALKLSDADLLAVTLETTPAQLPQWTSMAHLELVLALERAFGITFEAEEIANLASVAAIAAALRRNRAT